MKWIGLVLLGLFSFQEARGAALAFTPTITLTAVGTTKVRIQFTARATGLDTIKVRSAASDSATKQWWFKAAASKDTTVVSQVPMTQYIWLVRCDSSGVYKYSVADTITTFPPQIVTVPLSILDDYRTMGLATSYPDSSLFASAFTIADDSGLDSTMVYENFPFNGIHVTLTGDSAKVSLRLCGGFSTNAKALYHPTPSSVVWKYAVIDSVTYTAKGTYVWSPSIPAAARYFYIELFGDTDNGHATGVALAARRVRW